MSCDNKDVKTLRVHRLLYKDLTAITKVEIDWT